MYAYPSGDAAHRALVRRRRPTDAIARYHRMQGDNVFLPIGFDAFGLPAENAAIKNRINPRDWTMANIDTHAPPAADDGRRLRLDGRGRHLRPGVLPLEPVAVPAVPGGGPRLSRGLARRLVPQRRDARARAGRGRRPPLLALRREGREARAGRSGTCGSRTTRTSCWTSRASTGRSPIRLMQTNWIGRSTGAEIVFETAPAAHHAGGEELRVFTTRPDTLYGATFMVLAPEHPLVAELTAPDRKADVEAYVDAAAAQDRDRPPVRRSREDGRADRRGRDQPGQRRADPDLHRRLRAGHVRHRRDHGRPGARRARLRVRDEVRAADRARHRARTPTPTSR